MPTTAQVTRPTLKLNELTRAPQGLAWLERRPDQDGRTTVVAWTERGGAVDVTPPDMDVGSDVHGYGGGVYAVTPAGCYAVDSDDSQIVHIDPGGTRRLVQVGGSNQYADLAATSDAVLCIRESSASAGDALVSLANGEETVLVRDEFLAAPAPGPRDQLAWLRWSGDRMPWDATELYLASRSGSGLSEPTRIAGGSNESILEPQWGPDGALYFQSDRTGWWNLYRWNGRAVQAVAPILADCAAAPWELGYRSYSFLSGGRIGLILSTGSRDTLAICGNGRVEPVALPHTSVRPYLVTRGGRLAVIASSATKSPQVVLIDPNQPKDAKPIAGGNAESATPLSVAEHLELSTADGQPLNALVYPPTGMPKDWRAPLIVRPHPGPTDNMHDRLDWRIQFFTARGFAVAEVDYRGSTGYGRAFRESLYGHWGSYDVADCRVVAEHLIASGQAIPGQVFISGESAGGYTALKAVSDPSGPFAAAVAALAIIDPGRWQQTAARFQRAHALQLTGPAGPVRPEEIHRPVLLLHGSKDTIAPVRDVVELADALVAHGTPHRLIVFDGAGHGFTAPAHAVAALDAELTHYRAIIQR